MARKYRIKKSGNGFVIEMAHGGKYQPCDKFGLWNHKPIVYRNEYTANLNKKYFENRTTTASEQSDPIL